MCRVHYCPECALDDTLPGQEASETEICGECAAEYNDPWDELYDDDGNYIPDVVYDVDYLPADEREGSDDL